VQINHGRDGECKAGDDEDWADNTFAQDVNSSYVKATLWQEKEQARDSANDEQLHGSGNNDAENNLNLYRSDVA